MVIAVFILMPPSLISVYVFAGAMGSCGLSTVPLTSGLWPDLRHPAHEHAVRLRVLQSSGGRVYRGVGLAGRCLTSTGSYILAWWVAIGLGVLAGPPIPLVRASSRIALASRSVDPLWTSHKVSARYGAASGSALWPCFVSLSETNAPVAASYAVRAETGEPLG